jgi:D-alanyl-D-alanine endopeptidase (penicillin-binding protein 7)
METAGMQTAERKLHSLEKTLVVALLFAVLALSFGFADAAGKRKKAKAPRPIDQISRAVPHNVLIKSSVALVQDVTSGETILGKNPDAVAPIASLTKLMTALVVLDNRLDLNQRVAISSEDTDHLKGTHSRLSVGTVLTRDELLLIALMASENRAAAALGRTYPGGLPAFVAAMNDKAVQLGMRDTRFVDATGLNSANVSSARDLARLVVAAHEQPLIREYSTRESGEVESLGRRLAYRNTNGLVRSPDWHIELSKTGFISEAGRCLVMRLRLASREVVVVLLDSWGKHTRTYDAMRIRKWLESRVAAAPRG